MSSLELEKCGYEITPEMLNDIFNYTVQTNEEKQIVELDLSMVAYNELYKLPEFYEQKFPRGYENIPAFDTIIQSIAYMNIDNSPLQEYELRIANK